MDLDVLMKKWKDLGYELELKDLGMLKPIAHAKAKDVLITITTNDVKILTLSQTTWTEWLNHLLKITQEFLGYESIEVIRNKIKENFETEDYKQYSQSSFELTVEGCKINFYSNKFELVGTPITPKTLKLINRIAKVLEWEVSENE